MDWLLLILLLILWTLVTFYVGEYVGHRHENKLRSRSKE